MPEPVTNAATAAVPFVPPKGMHKSTVDSMGIEDLFEYWEFDTAEACDAVAGEKGACNRLANLYMRQKGVLVDGRSDLQAKLETLTGFKMLMKTEKVTKDGVETTVSVPGEKPAEWWSRFRKAALTGALKHPAINGSSEATLDESIRVVSRQLGPYVCDPKKAVREAKAKTPPQWAINAAKNIIAAGAERIKHWVNAFTNGDTTVPKPTPFQPFDVKPPRGAKPEEVAAVEAANVTNLAWAIRAYDAEVSKSRYV